MAGKGFKIADAFVEVTLNRDTLRQEIAGLPGELDGEVDAAGRSIGNRLGQQAGDQVGRGIGEGIGKAPVEAPAKTKGTEAGDKFGNAFSTRVKAAIAALPAADIRLDDEYAQTKLDFIREELASLGEKRIGVDISDVDAIAKLHMLREQLDVLAAASPSVRIKADTAAATAEIDRFLALTEVKSEAAGQDAGDKLSKGMQKGISGASPLIRAAISGVLIAGAPAAIAAAGVLFGGLAAVAVHSSAEIQQAATNAANQVMWSFKSAAAVTVPMFQQALGRLATAIVNLNPLFYDAFASLGVPIDSLTTGLIRLMQNVMPGLVAAVKASGPVFQGLADLLASIGTGLGQFFGIIAQHSTAAGQVFSQIGQIIASLLPFLGQLIGQGAELASVILPPLVSILHAVVAVLTPLAPLLPAIATGFASWKVISSVSGWLKNVGDDAGGLQKVLGGLVSSVPALGTALGGVGLAVGILATDFVLSQQQINEWAQALLQGGNAAEQTTTKIDQWQKTLSTGVLGIGANITGITNLTNAFGVGTNSMDSAQKKAKELFDAMSPLQQAQQRVTQAQNDLESAIQKWGPDSGQAAGASVNLKEKQDALAQAQAQLQQATHGVTQAMLDEANQALAMADSNFAAQEAAYRTKDAEDAVAQAIKDHGINSEQAQKATLGFNEALSAQAAASGKAAADASGLTDKMELQKVQQAATLQELLSLKQQYGTEFPAALDETIARMEASGVTLDWLGQKHPVATADVNTNPLQQGINNSLGWLYNLGGQRPTPVAGLNANPFSGVATGVFSTLMSINLQRPNPVAFLSAITGPAEAAIDYAARTRYATIYTTVSGGRMPMVATGGNVGAVTGPRFDMGGGVFSGRLRGPGGPTDDLIQAVSTSGAPLRVSNDEWVINGAVSTRQGARKMAMLNAGQADIVPRGSSTAAVGTSSAAIGSGGGGGAATVTINRLDVHLEGTFDFTDPTAMRRAALAFEQELIKITRERN